MYYCHDTSFAAGPVLIVTEIANNFNLNQGSSSTPQRVANGDIWFLTKRLEPRLLPWQWHNLCITCNYFKLYFMT